MLRLKVSLFHRDITSQSIQFIYLCSTAHKKQLKNLHEQNKLLNLSLIDVQEKYDKRLKELEDRLNHQKMSYI